MFIAMDRQGTPVYHLNSFGDDGRKFLFSGCRAISAQERARELLRARSGVRSPTRGAAIARRASFRGPANQMLGSKYVLDADTWRVKFRKAKAIEACWLLGNTSVLVPLLSDRRDSLPCNSEWIRNAGNHIALALKRRSNMLLMRLRRIPYNLPSSS